MGENPKLIFFPPNRFLPMLMPKTEDGKTSGPDLSMLRSNDIQVIFTDYFENMSTTNFTDIF